MVKVSVGDLCVMCVTHTLTVVFGGAAEYEMAYAGIVHTIDASGKVAKAIFPSISDKPITVVDHGVKVCSAGRLTSPVLDIVSTVPENATFPEIVEYVGSFLKGR